MSLASSLCQAAILAALILAAAESVNGMPHTAAGRLHTLRPSASEAKQLSGRSPDPSDSAFQNSLHLSTALAGMIVLIVLEYSVNTVGYLLSRSWWRATDSILWILMGLISATWTAFIFLSAYIWEGNSDNPCSIDPSGAPCAARLAFAPWILNGVFLWWCVRLALHRIRRLLISRLYLDGGAPKKPNALIPRIRKRWMDFKGQNKFKRWNKFKSWDKFKRWKKWFVIHKIQERLMAFLVWALVASAVVWTAVGAFRTQLFTLGMLLSASAVILLGCFIVPISHVHREHYYAMDDIRIPLHSPGEQGIVYILPSGKYGFDATYSQTFDSEQEVLDANLKFFDPHHLDEDWTLKKCRVAAQDFIETQIKKIVVDSEIRDLALWLHWHRRDSKKVQHPLQDRKCKKRKGYETLIGRDLILALLLWEYLVFERRWQLQADCELVPMVWRLRDSKHSGAVFVDNDTVPRDENSQTMGSLEGLDGFLQAVGEVYRIVGVVGEEGEEGNRDVGEEGDGDVGEEGDGDTGDLEKGRMRQESVPRKEDTDKTKTAYWDKKKTKIAYWGEKKTKELLERLDKDKLPNKLPNKLPKTTVVNNGNSDEESKIYFSSFEDYAGKLWEKCWAEYPSTFGALYLWTTVWYIDVGNIGFHTTPLVPRGGTGGWGGWDSWGGRADNGPDYATTWRMPWRGLWHATVRCQVVVLLPTLISSFSGLLAAA